MKLVFTPAAERVAAELVGVTYTGAMAPLRFRAFVVTLTLATASCSSSGSQQCTAEYVVTALEVSVSDAVKGACVEEATATATDASGRMVPLGSSPGFGASPCGNYTGLGDGEVQAPGAWTIKVSKTGYQSSTTTITMSQNGCHVISQRLAVKLAP